ncbi:MAG: DUF2585 domain-containing protein [Candidatus Doudnabacteria bacterium]|nr:DUF2585 domain-containing protein [Candidatus Doudnabacteria bacterium]
MNWLRLSHKQYLVLGISLILLSGIILYLMGQVPICKCGYVKFWHGVTFSSENSQHITDWYSFSHVIHGFAFYFILWMVFRKRLPLGALFVMAVVIEAAWEIFENTDLIINRYREVTISLDYYGDSVINSISDQLAMVFGFYLAYKMPIWFTIFLVIAMELIVGYFIRDNLTLNIIMLLFPLDSIRNWQSGG